MKKILFVCHGNICRSPMAEYLFRDMVKQANMQDEIRCASAATSREEIGNPVHRGTKEILAKHRIYPYEKRAVQLRASDYDIYDYLIGMDADNLIDMKAIILHDEQHKLYRLLDFTRHPRDIADPWYTHDFQTTYQDIQLGCQALLDVIKQRR